MITDSSDAYMRHLASLWQYLIADRFLILLTHLDKKYYKNDKYIFKWIPIFTVFLLTFPEESLLFQCPRAVG